MSEGGSMRSLSGKVLWFWVFLLIFYPLLVWTTGWIRRKKAFGLLERSWGHSPCFDLDWGLRENAYMTAKAYHILRKTENAKHIFTHFFTHVYTCVSGFFLGLHMCKWILFGLHMCKWFFFGLHMCKWIFFDLHILTHPYTSIHIHTHSGILWSFWFMFSYNDIIWYETKPN